MHSIAPCDLYQWSMLKNPTFSEHDFPIFEFVHLTSNKVVYATVIFEIPIYARSIMNGVIHIKLYSDVHISVPMEI